MLGASGVLKQAYKGHRRLLQVAIWTQGRQVKGILKKTLVEMENEGYG